jgi:hypothetical protein
MVVSSKLKKVLLNHQQIICLLKTCFMLCLFKMVFREEEATSGVFCLYTKQSVHISIFWTSDSTTIVGGLRIPTTLKIGAAGWLFFKLGE